MQYNPNIAEIQVGSNRLEHFQRLFGLFPAALHFATTTEWQNQFERQHLEEAGFRLVATRRSHRTRSRLFLWIHLGRPPVQEENPRLSTIEGSTAYCCGATYLSTLTIPPPGVRYFFTLLNLRRAITDDERRELRRRHWNLIADWNYESVWCNGRAL